MQLLRWFAHRTRSFPGQILQHFFFFFFYVCTDVNFIKIFKSINALNNVCYPFSLVIHRSKMTVPLWNIILMLGTRYGFWLL